MPERNKFVNTFKTVTHLRDKNRIRSIGVSNFEPEHLKMLIDATGIVPAVNQVELHPRLPQSELREVHAQLGIATEAWGPLGQGSLLTHPTITAVAEGCGKTPAQVLISWRIRVGNIVIPKSVNLSGLRATSRCSTSNSTMRRHRSPPRWNTTWS